MFYVLIVLALNVLAYVFVYLPFGSGPVAYDIDQLNLNSCLGCPGYPASIQKKCCPKDSSSYDSYNENLRKIMLDKNCDSDQWCLRVGVSAIEESEDGKKWWVSFWKYNYKSVYLLIFLEIVVVVIGVVFAVIEFAQWFRNRPKIQKLPKHQNVNKNEFNEEKQMPTDEQLSNR